MVTTGVMEQSQIEPGSSYALQRIFLCVQEEDDIVNTQLS